MPAGTVTGAAAGIINYSTNGDIGSSVADSPDALLIFNDGLKVRKTIGARGRGSTLRAYQFGFDMPSTATLVGIQLDVYGWAEAANTVSDYFVGLSLDTGTALPTKTGDRLGGANMARGALVYVGTTNGLIASYGGPTDRWGFLSSTSLTARQMSDPNFGVDLQWQNHQSSAQQAIDIDQVVLTIWYDYEQNFTASIYEKLDDEVLSASISPIRGSATLSEAADLGGEVEAHPIRGRASFADMPDGLAASARLSVDGGATAAESIDPLMASMTALMPTPPARISALMDRSAREAVLADGKARTARLTDVGARRAEI